MSSAAWSGVNFLYATFSISVNKIFLSSELLETPLYISPGFFAASSTAFTDNGFTLFASNAAFLEALQAV